MLVVYAKETSGEDEAAAAAWPTLLGSCTKSSGGRGRSNLFVVVRYILVEGGVAFDTIPQSASFAVEA